MNIEQITKANDLTDSLSQTLTNQKSLLREIKADLHELTEMWESMLNDLSQ